VRCHGFGLGLRSAGLGCRLVGKRFPLPDLVGLFDGFLADVAGWTRRCSVRFLRATQAIAATSRINATTTTTIQTIVLVVMSARRIG